MLNVAGSSFIRHQIAKLMDAGVEHVVFATSYLASLFEEEFKDFSRNLQISYAVEEVPLGTGGAIRNARLLRGGAADAPVLILNGDILSGVDLRAILRAARGQGRGRHPVPHPGRRPARLRSLPTGEDGRVLSFLEKPKTAEECVTDQINAGCYVFGRSSWTPSPPTARSRSSRRPSRSSSPRDGACSDTPPRTTGATSVRRWPSSTARPTWSPARRPPRSWRRPPTT
ncbi:nucleotidyltransferase family protein [Streptomyces sp. T1317-0309]|nr:nucleotidyltransferase family protein [Streptomyces sp. T1317-0309]